MNHLTWNFKSEDPLIIENQRDSEQKNEKLQKGIDAIQGMSFRSSLLSFNKWSNGNFQTIYKVFKDQYRLKFKNEFIYDKREEFVFKDGGKIYLDFKGNGFIQKKQKCQRPIIFLCIGLASHSKTGFILDIVEHLTNVDGREDQLSFDVVVINWRGLAGMKLHSPTFYCGSSTSDILEPMEYVYEKYIRPFDRKAFAVGCSMGGNILINALAILGSKSFIEAACVICVPMKMWEVEDHILTSCYGLYNKSFGNTLKRIILENKEILKQNQNIFEELDELEIQKDTTFLHMGDKILGPLFGFKNGTDLNYNVSCYHNIPKLKVPTLFINAKDDPVIGPKAIDFEIFKNNQYAVLATTQTGGHLGYHESVFKSQLWITDPIIKFLNAFTQ